MKNFFAFILPAALITSVVGCRSEPATVTGPATMSPATTNPATTQSTSGAGIFETYRVAEPADLQLSIYGIKPAADGFAGVVLMLRNTSGHDVVVAYGPGSVTVHCGPFIQSGPARVFGRRREVLDPEALIVFDPPEKGWTQLSSDGQPELMIPTRLPPGKYNIWATFEVPGPHGGIIQSDKRDYQAQ
jgi:hypothetical protein